MPYSLYYKNLISSRAGDDFLVGTGGSPVTAGRSRRLVAAMLGADPLVRAGPPDPLFAVF